MKKKPIIKIYPHPQELARSAAEDIFQALNRTFQAEKKFHIALSGGNTPRSIYEHLAIFPKQQSPIWKNVHFFWGDERCVPPDHPESNYRMAYEAFLSKIAVPLENIHRIQGEAPPEIEVSRYAKEIQNHLPAFKNGFPRFDWILLGVGEDGHTASLFPNALSLQEQRRLCVLAEHPQTGQIRISLTMPLINNSSRISFFAAGKEKALIVEAILNQAPSSSKYPASLVQPHHGHVEWYLDETAAQKLRVP